MLTFFEDEDGNTTFGPRPGEELLLYATSEDENFEAALKTADLTARDPMMGYTALHFAAEAGSERNVQRLIDRGAIWNLIDNSHRNAAEIALAEGHQRCYDMIFASAVRTEYEHWYKDPNGVCSIETMYPCPWYNYPGANEEYIASPVSYGKQNDQTVMISSLGVGVMMEWERPIMEKTARLLCDGLPAGKSILNIGFGLGIIDSYFQEYAPAHHTIIEAHPTCIKYMRANGWYNKPGVRILECRWQDFINPDFSARNQKIEIGRFDIVYFDTFQERYLGHLDFLRCVPRLLVGPTSRFSFFNGHSKGHKMSYEVYAEVLRWHANDVGLNTEWHDAPHIDPSVQWTGRELGSVEEPHKIPISALAPTTPRTFLPEVGWSLAPPGQIKDVGDPIFDQ